MESQSPGAGAERSSIDDHSLNHKSVCTALGEQQLDDFTGSQNRCGPHTGAILAEIDEIDWVFRVGMAANDGTI